MMMESLKALECSNEFVSRHIGPSDKDIQYMLATLGFETIDQLMSLVIPDNIKIDNALDFDSISEAQALEALARMSAKNMPMKSLIGLGYHDTHTPSVISPHRLVQTQAGRRYQADVAALRRCRKYPQRSRPCCTKARCRRNELASR